MMRDGKGETSARTLRAALEELSCQCNVSFIDGAGGCAREIVKPSRRWPSDSILLQTSISFSMFKDLR
jgi:hypothetical protein